MKHPSSPPAPQPAPNQKRDTPFDPYRYQIRTMPAELQRELIAVRLPLLDPKDLSDTNPPNGGLAAPDLEAPPPPAQRSRAIVAVGVVALVVIGAAVIWPLATSHEPGASPATTAEVNASGEPALDPVTTSDEKARMTPRLPAIGVQLAANDPQAPPGEPVEGSRVMATPKSASPPDPVQRVVPERRAPLPPLTPRSSQSRPAPPKPTPPPDSAPQPAEASSLAAVEPRGEEPLIQLKP